MLSNVLLFAQEAAPDTVSDAFFGLDAGQRFVVILVALGCGTAVLIATTGIIAGVYATMVNRRELNELKQDLLEQGMNAQEIAEVIEAAPVTDAASRWVKAKFYNVKGRS